MGSIPDWLIQNHWEATQESLSQQLCRWFCCLLTSEKHGYSTTRHDPPRGVVLILGVWVHLKGFFSGERKHALYIRMNPASLVPATAWFWVSRFGGQRGGPRKTGLGFQRLNRSSQSAQEGTLTSFLLNARVFAVQLCLLDIAGLRSEKGKVNQMSTVTLSVLTFVICMISWTHWQRPMHYWRGNILLQRVPGCHSFSGIPVPRLQKSVIKWAVMIVAVNTQSHTQVHMTLFSNFV